MIIKNEEFIYMSRLIITKQTIIDIIINLCQNTTKYFIINKVLIEVLWAMNNNYYIMDIIVLFTLNT